MDDKVRDVLRDLVTREGEGILSSRDRLRGLLSDECPESSKEINVLSIAAQAHVPAEIQAHAATEDPRGAVTAGVLRLEHAFGLGQEAATWAVLSIAFALGRINEDQFRRFMAGSPESQPSPPPPPVYHPPSTPAPPPPPVQPPSRDLHSAPLAPAPPVAQQYPVAQPQPVAQKKKGGLGKKIGIAGLVTVALIIILSKMAPDTPDTANKPDRTPETSASHGEAPPANATAYTDSSGYFKMYVPSDWLFRRSESDMTLDTVPTHVVRAVIFDKQAEHSDIEGWVSEGIRVSIYLPPQGKVWGADWASKWQQNSINAAIQSYARVQNTPPEQVQFGNVQAFTTGVSGESPKISQPEVARIYAVTAQKYVMTVEVAMPAAKRAAFDSLDAMVRRGFEMTLQ